jgi:hypothetical protein
MRRSLALLLSLSACTGPSETPDPSQAVAHPPFPSAFFADAERVRLPDDLPHADTPIPVERMNGRDGFSPVQSAVVHMDVPLDPTTLPGLDDIGTPGSIVLWDRTDGRALPAFAELDAFPDLGLEAPTLIVRPAAPIPVGHDVAVVITDAVQTLDGQPFPAPDWFTALGDGVAPLGQDPAVWQGLLDDLAAQGAPAAQLAFGWRTGDGTAALRSVLDDLQTPTSWVLDEPVTDALPHTYKQIRGTFDTTSWLVDDRQFDLDDNLLPILQGTAASFLFVHVPESVREAPAGRAPVWIFGHGIFSEPESYFGDAEDLGGVLDLANRAGAIVIATKWRGLTTSDIAVPLSVGSDFGTFPSLTDKLVQGVANTVALSRLVIDGDLLNDPFFEGKADKSTVRYYGISLGSIEGAVVMSQQPALSHAVLHVGGSTWSTMLERSANWSTFESFVTSGIDSAYDRQLLYGVSQLFWDPVDPALYADQLTDRSVLWQVALGDDQVPNITSWTLLRGVGATLLDPSAEHPWGLNASEGPLSRPAVSTFDPQLGNDDADNRPSPKTHAHELPRLWEGAKLQTLSFLGSDTPGQVFFNCGRAPCTPENSGPPPEVTP